MSESPGTLLECKVKALDLHDWSAQSLDVCRKFLQSHWGFKPSRSQTATYLFYRLSCSQEQLVESSHNAKVFRTLFRLGKTFRIRVSNEAYRNLQNYAYQFNQTIPTHVSLVASVYIRSIAQSVGKEKNETANRS